VWPLEFSATSASGVCNLSASINGQPPITANSPQPNNTQWQQCTVRLSTRLSTPPSFRRARCR
jgi:hypothetical protein